MSKEQRAWRAVFVATLPIAIACGASGSGHPPPVGDSLGSSGSSGSSGSPGSSGSSGSSGSADCLFTGGLTGGVTGAVTNPGCGTGGTSDTFFIAPLDVGSLGVRFVLVTALKGGELGAIPLKTFEVYQVAGGAALPTWSSTSCTLTLDQNVAAPTSLFTNRFLLAGRGSCTAPLDPTAPNTLPAVTVSPFELKAFVDPH
jgi:hypothetical protein